MHLNPGDRVRLGTAGLRVLFTADQICARVTEISGRLRERIGSDSPVFIGLLNGGFIFLGDLIRRFDQPHEIDFLKVSRFDPRHRDPSSVRVVHDLRSNIRGRTVVVVEGIRARGSKIQYVDRFLRLHEPTRIEYCALIQPSEAHLEVPLHESGFSIDNEYVVGYGLDLDEHHRNLPFIGAIEPGPKSQGDLSS